MPWNHRVIRQKTEDPDEPYWYTMHEVYYDEEGSVKAWTAEPIDVSSESLEGMRWQLEHMLKALDKPMLDLEELEAQMVAKQAEQERQYQEKYGSLSLEEKLAALDHEIDDLCPAVEDGKHCDLNNGHEDEHMFSDPEKMLRNQLEMDYYPMRRLMPVWVGEDGQPCEAPPAGTYQLFSEE